MLMVWGKGKLACVKSKPIGFTVSQQKAATSEDSGKKKEFQNTARFRAANFWGRVL